MFAALVVSAVVALWKTLSVLDDVADIPIITTVGRALTALLAAVAVLHPAGFAEGTRQVVDEEAREYVVWFTHSIERALDP